MNVQKIAAFINRHKDVCVFFFFVAIALIITLPFIFNPFHILVSPINGDAGYSSILFEAIKREHLNPFLNGVASSVAYPDGILINTGVNRVSFFSTLFLWAGTIATNAIFTHSILAICGVVLSAFITYLFVKSITHRRAPGLIAGLIVGFSPLMLAILFSASPYTHMWLYVAVIWVFWEIVVKGLSFKRFSLAFGVVFLSLFWTPYYTYHVLLVAAACMVVVAIVTARNRGMLVSLAYCLLSVVVVGAFVVIYYLIGISSQFSDIPNRSIDEIYEQSAHPLMYFLPSAFTVFQGGINDILIQIVPRAKNTSLYVGISSIILMIFAFLELRNSRRISREIKFAIILSTAVLTVTFLFSLAPTIHILGVNIPTPNILIAEFAPSLRAGQRLAMPLITVVAILAGIGVYSLQKRFGTKFKPFYVLLIMFVVIVDLASYPPQRYTITESRQIFHQLAERSPGLTATYMYDSLVANPGQYICYPQFEYKMPIVNDCAIQRDPYNFDKPKKNLASIIGEPICRQLEMLELQKVKYLIISREDNELIYGCLSSNKHFELVLKDDIYDIYERRKN